MAAKAMLIRFAIGMALAVTAISTQATARGGGMPSEDLWAAVHIEGLPATVRRVISRETQECGGKLAAQHAFTRYIAGAHIRLIAVHYEHTNCPQRRVLCSDGSCLHQVFVSSGGDYRLVLSVHAVEIELQLVNKSPAVAIDCHSGSRCTRTLIWNGSRFVPH